MPRKPKEKSKVKSNPNGANQYTTDPRQVLFLTNYLDPKSKTFSNAYRSGIKAGYGEEYSRNLLSKGLDWLSESVDSSALLQKAEKRLKQILDFEPQDEKGKIDNALIANQMKGIVLITKGIGKDKYSERVENTGKDGGAIVIDYAKEAKKRSKKWEDGKENKI